MKRWKITSINYRPPPPARPFTLSGGWVEIWEHGRYLGLLVGYAVLESFILRRPGRVFVVRFVQRELDGCVLPVGSFAAEAAADGHPRVRYFPLDQMRKKGGKK
jgi:hypothetical protein